MEKNFNRCFLSGICVVAMLAASNVFGVTLDNARVVVGNTAASAGEGTVGAFTYNETNNTFYTTIFGSSYGLRTISNTGGSWTGGWSTNEDSYASDMARFMGSTDVPAGIIDFDTTTVYCTPSGIMLNPAPLTIDVVAADAAGVPIVDEYGEYVTTPITYQAGELAFVMDMCVEMKISDVKMPEYTKKMYRWDLRTIGEATTAQPDYSTGGSGITGISGPAWGDLGQADWNDALAVVFTEQDLRDAAAAGGATPGSDNIGRQFAWSSDGQSMYAVESSTYQGGIYKIDACTGDLDWIYHENLANNIGAEPTVVPTTAFDFTGGTLSGDQIIFDGSEANGNDGGISYVVHDGTNTSSAQVLVDGTELRAWAENSGIGINSLTSDSEGNLYFYVYGQDATTSLYSAGLFVRDTEGRFACVLNRAQLYEINESEDGSRSDGGGMLRLQVLEDGDSTSVLYRGDNKYIGEVDIPVLGDLTDDGIVDTADCTFMIDQYKKTCYDAVPSIPVEGAEAFVDYLIADMNGNASSVKSGAGVLENAPVTFADVETLAQFVDGGLLTGDLNWDGIVDDADWAIFDANYEVAPTVGVWSWFDGDMDLDGDVDADDRALMSPQVAGDANGDGVVDGSDVTILAANWQKGVDDGLTATWAEGDFNGDGKVDGSDVTILAGNWQYGVGTAASAVPEPSTIVLILLGLASLAVRRVKR